jgi:hypothetical protein
VSSGLDALEAYHTRHDADATARTWRWRSRLAPPCPAGPTTTGASRTDPIGRAPSRCLATSTSDSSG